MGCFVFSCELDCCLALILDLLELVHYFRVELRCKFHDVGIGFILEGFSLKCQVFLGFLREPGFERRCSGLYCGCDFSLFEAPSVLEDFLGLWSEVVSEGLSGNHLDDGVFELQVDGVDPGFDVRVKFAQDAGQCLRVGVLASDVRDKSVNEHSRLSFASYVNIFDGFANGFVMQGFAKSVDFQGIGKHYRRDICRGRGKVDGFDTAYA